MKLNSSIIDSIIKKIENPEFISDSELKAINNVYPAVEVQTVGHMVFVDCFGFEYKFIIDDKPIGLDYIETTYIMSPTSEITTTHRFAKIEHCVRYVILYHFYLNIELNSIFQLSTSQIKNIVTDFDSIKNLELNSKKENEEIKLTREQVIVNEEQPVKKKSGPKPGTKYTHRKQVIEPEPKPEPEPEILPINYKRGAKSSESSKVDIELLNAFINSRYGSAQNLPLNNTKFVLICIARIKLRMNYSAIQQVLNLALIKNKYVNFLKLSLKNRAVIESSIRMISPLPQPLKITVEEIQNVAKYLKENDNENWNKY